MIGVLRRHLRRQQVNPDLSGAFVNPLVSVIFQLFNAYLFKITQSRFGLVNRLVTAFVLAPVSLLGLILSALLPDNPDLFLDQLVVAERL